MRGYFGEYSASVYIFHNDVIKWKHFPRNWPFVQEIHRSPVNSPRKGQWREALMFSIICLNKRLSKQCRRRWFGTPLRSSWRHGNSTYLIGSGTACLPSHHDQRLSPITGTTKMGTLDIYLNIQWISNFAKIFNNEIFFLSSPEIQMVGVN